VVMAFGAAASGWRMSATVAAHPRASLTEDHGQITSM
jgi:hypothetical protein